MSTSEKPEDILRRTTPALLILDPENRFFWTERDGAALAPAAILPNLIRILEAARSCDILRVFSTVTRAPQALSDAWERRRIHLSRGIAPSLDASVWGRRLVESASPHENEILIRKLRMSALYGTSLETYLRNNGVGTLVLCGVATNGAVLATAMDAASLDLYCFVVKDAAAGTTAELHDATMAVLGEENLIDARSLCQLWTSG